MKISKNEWHRLCHLMNAYVYSQTLETACDLRLFDHLDKMRRTTCQKISSALRLAPHSTRALLLACCAAGLIERETKSKCYRNSNLARKFLRTQAPLSMIDFIRFNSLVQHRCMLRLTASLKEQRNAGLDEFPGPGRTLYERFAGYPELEKMFHAGMGAFTRIAPTVVNLRGLKSVRHLTDVGGGDGTLAIQLCQTYPDIEIHILEKPSVCRLALQKIRNQGFEKRIQVSSVDMFNADWGECQNIMLSHIVEIFSPEKINQLYCRAFKYLRPAGQLFVWTIMSNDAETTGLQASKSTLYFLSTASGEGMAYPGSQHVEWLKAAGFSGIKRYNSPVFEHGALVARKRAV